MPDKGKLATFLLLLVLAVRVPLARADSVSVTAVAQTLCGDSIVEPGEQCDGLDLNSASCVSQGFASGTLSCSSRCTLVTDECETPLPSGSSGGGGAPVTSVDFSGRAYPLATVVLLEDGSIRGSIGSDASARFDSVLAVDAGLHTFGVYAVDRSGRRSPRVTFTLDVPPSTVAAASRILLAPTIDVNAAAAGQSKDLAVFGITVPQSVVDLFLDGAAAPLSGRAANDGSYALILPTEPLASGVHGVQVRSVTPDGQMSGLSDQASFTVAPPSKEPSEGTPTTTPSSTPSEGPSVPPANQTPGDINHDRAVGLPDLSILLYWWDTSSPDGLAAADLNHDGRVDLIDLSILLFDWSSVS